VRIAFNFELEISEAEMASNPSIIGGLDFSALVTAVNSVKLTLQGVQSRLANVAPQAGSTDPAQSAAAQAEIQTLASQLNGAVTALNQVNTAAQQAAGTTPAPEPQAPPTDQGTTGQPEPTPAPVTPVAAPATPEETPAPAVPAPTETGSNVPQPSTPGQ
jgi:hypothetical protein